MFAGGAEPTSIAQPPTSGREHVPHLCPDPAPRGGTDRNGREDDGTGKAKGHGEL